MTEQITAASINETFRRVTALSVQAIEVMERLRELHERERSGEDVAAKLAASSDRLRELRAEIERLRRPLLLLQAPPAGGSN